MDTPVLSISNLSKLYYIAYETERYRTLRGQLAAIPRRLATRIRHPGLTTDSRQELWALRDVNLEVAEGEVLGVIGRNGAGKSTLLKVLSRIAEPTTGVITVRGRVGSLLEVGAGFHPELTGRENVFMNGAVLGMSRVEIQRRFDEIVEFAETEKFIDTPVKRYSSGMYVRLAFAVAAHLDCEILVVDEVLAVGDAAFQRKCLGKMSEVSRGGRTVLFVSHNVGLVSQLCSRTALLSGGRLDAVGPTDEVVTRYLTEGRPDVQGRDLRTITTRTGNGEARFTAARAEDASGEPCGVFHIGDTMRLVLDLEFREGVPSARYTVAAVDDRGVPVFHIADADLGCTLERPRANETLELTFDDMRLYPGEYSISVWVGASSVDETYDSIEDCVRFEVAQGGPRVRRTLARHAGTVFLTPSCRRL